MRMTWGTVPAGKAMAALASGLLLLAALAAIAVNGLNRPVSFDGAMNLQVAQSLAEGKGYVREYGGVRPFPREVQTNTPYVLPAAAVIRVFGIGLVQSQIVNLAYILGFLALVVAIGARFHGLAAGFAAALVLLVVPGFRHIGMNGWGEMVALFWWLAGTWWLLGEGSPSHRRLALLAGGACLGLAIATKTVIFIGVGATGATYAIWTLVRNGRRVRQSFVDLLIAACGVALPLVLVEAWRLASLGGLDAFVAWWGDQIGAITWQTGVAQGSDDAKTTKLASHFQALAGMTQLPAWVLALWLLVPLAWSGMVLARNPVRDAWHRLWSATMLVVVVYLVWWLMITPDSHVRLRRIEIGLILAQGLWLFCWGWARGRIGSAPARIGSAILPGLVFLVVTGLFANDMVFELRKRWLPDMGAFERLVAQVRRLPPDAKLFGKGFLSAPVLALYGERDLDDIDRYTAVDLARIGSGYVVVDPPAAKARRFGPELRRYPHQLVADDLNYRVYRMDFTRRNNPFGRREMKAADIPGFVDFTARHYPLVFGMHRPSRGGWRWTRTDAEILLRYGGESTVELRVLRSDQPHVKPGPLVLSASIGTCRLGSRPLSRKGKHLIRFEIPPRCRPTGDTVRLQLESDNMLAPVRGDQRQLSYVTFAAGFAE